MILHVTAGSSWWLFAAANLILFLHMMVFWLIRVRFTPWFKSPRFPHRKTVPQFSQ